MTTLTLEGMTKEQLKLERDIMYLSSDYKPCRRNVGLRKKLAFAWKKYMNFISKNQIDLRKTIVDQVRGATGAGR